MKKLFFVFAIIFFFSFKINSFSQKESWNWYFFNNAAITFNTPDTIPVALDSCQLFDIEVSGSPNVISDKNGNLLFYTFNQKVNDYNSDGIYNPIYNKKNKPMLNSFYQDTNRIFIQKIIVPMPGSKNKYYIFKYGEIRDYTPPIASYLKEGLMYDIVDMNANNGLGAAVARDVSVNHNMGYSLNVVKHANNIDYWIIYYSLFKPNTNQYIDQNDWVTRVYLLTNRGIIDTVMNPPIINLFGGFTCQNPANNSIFALIDNIEIKFFKFDNKTGNIKLDVSYFLPNNYHTRDGACEFSADGSKFYTTETLVDVIDQVHDIEIQTTGIYQYSISGSILDQGSRKLIGKTIIEQSGVSHAYRDLERGPNGKIYIMRDDTNYISALENPNDSASKIIFTERAIDLKKGVGTIFFPRFIPDYYNVNLELWKDTTVCEGDTVFLKANASDSLAKVTYKWFLPDSTVSDSQNISIPNIKLTINGYFVCEATINGKNGAKIYDSVLVTVIPKPVFSILGKDTLKKDETTELTPTLINKNFKYIWSTGETSDSIKVSEPGIYKLTITNQNGCTYTDSIQIFAEFAYIYSDRDTICPGTALTLSIKPDSIQGTYLWSTGDTSKSIVINQKGNYQVIIDYGNSKYDTLKKEIFEYNVNQVKINASPNNWACMGDSIKLMPENSSEYVSFKWSNNETETNIYVNTSGIYRLIAIDKNGCQSTDSINIKIFPQPQPIITGIPAICSGGFTTLSSKDKYQTYNWSTGDTTQSTKVSQFGIVFLNVTDINGCTGYASIDVTSGTSPIINITGDSTFCMGSSTILTANSSENNVKYLWSYNGDTTKSIIVSQPSIIVLTVTDTNGCTSAASLTVQMLESELTGLENLYSFGKVVYGSDSIIPINIKSSSNVNFEINKIYLKDGSNFSVMSVPSVPFAIDSGAQFTIFVKFQPSDYDYFEDSLFIESDEPCNYIISSKVSGTGTGHLLIWVPMIDANVGYDVNIPLSGKMLTQKELTCDFSSVISIDDSYFFPDTLTNKNISYIKPNSNISIQNNSQLFTTDSTKLSNIIGLVLLGPTAHTPLAITQFTLSNPNIEVEIQNGILTDEGMCGGEFRRIIFVAPTTMSIKPNPSNGDDMEITIESGMSGNFELNIYSIEGSKIYSQNWEQESPDGTVLQRNYIINQNIIASGMYFVRLQMGTESITNTMFLVK